MAKRHKRAIAGVAAGTIVLVFWGMIFWGFLAGPLGMFHSLPDADVVTRVLLTGDTATGTYFFPWPRDTPEAFERFVAQHETGPFYKLSYIREGVDPQSGQKLLTGCLQYAGVAAIAVLLVFAVGGPYTRRAGVVFLAGTMGTLFISLADPIWFHLPWDYALGAVIYELVSWALLAAVCAAVVGSPEHRPS